jgi:uncharacterized iron-regulated membrane protein
VRSILALIHRWAGLFLAGFLFFSGATGAVISWDHELDEWLNPHLTKAPAVAQGVPSLQIAREIEARHHEVSVSYVPMATEAGHALAFGVEPRVNPATGRLFEEKFNQVFIDPSDGHELGKRAWGAAWPISKETFVSFLYMLHYSMHIPEMWGIDRWGIWLLGVVALVWTLDCFVGFYLTLPALRREAEASGDAEEAAAARTRKSFWQRWKPSFLVRTKAGNYKLNFDLHRAGGLWTWGLLFTVAFTAFSMNLYSEVFYPVMSLVSEITPSPFMQREPTDKHAPITPKLGFAEIVQIAEKEGKQRGWEQPVGGVFYANLYGIYNVTFHRPEDDHGAGGVGHRELYLDAHDGSTLGEQQPWQGTAADIFMQAQFPLHSGRILGLPGRVLISLMGVVAAMLSVTGVIVWWKKRAARVAAAARVRERRQPVRDAATSAS